MSIHVRVHGARVPRPKGARAPAPSTSLDLSRPDVRCPDAPVLATNVVDANGTLWAAAVVFRHWENASVCTMTPQCGGKPGADLALMGCDSMHIADVLGVPPDVETLDLAYNELRALNLSTASANGKLKEVVLTNNNITSMDDVLVPSSVQTLSLMHNHITTLKFSKAFSDLVALKISYNPILRVQLEANGIAELSATDINLTRLHDLTLPDSITTLDISDNPQLAFENFTAPHDLQTFRSQRSNITTLRTLDFSTAAQLSTIDLMKNTIREVAGVKFSPSLENLLLNGSDVSCFVVRESDVSVLSSLKQFNVSSLSQTNCSGADARGADQRSLDIGGSSYFFSVLDDTTFESRFYATSLTPAPSTVQPLSPTSDLQHTGSSASSVIYVSMAILAVAVVAAIGYVVHLRRRQVPRPDISRLDSDGESTISTSTLRSGMSFDDIRDEEAFVATRIPQEELVRSKLLGKGAFGVVYQATLRGETQVIIKQILPEKAKKPDAIQQFMDEIRLCAQLEHPKILQFLGISWSNLADLAVVMEFMANGDLASLLQTEHSRQRSRETFTWTLASYEATATRTKLELAIDVAEALVCLHSFSPPIIHRDLKASNILLSDAWVAKLSDFGVSRHVAQDMTAEVGTVAWTAPEVLRGSQYDEAADIYSFGVVMSELDTCEKPFVRQLLLRSLPSEATGGTIEEPSNAHIALAVAHHEAQPDFHDDCPPRILALARCCMAANPSDRPTATELLDDLMNIARDENVTLRLTTLAI